MKKTSPPKETPASKKRFKACRLKLDQDLEQATYIVFDLEYTGGNPNKSGIIEAAALRYSAGLLGDEFYTRVNPKIPIPAIVQKITGIKDEMLKNSPEISEVMPSLLKFLGDDILVSHNTQGDLTFLKHYASLTLKKPVPQFFLCTHILGSKLFPKAPDKSLSGFVKYLNLDVEHAHTAAGDSRLTLKLLKAIIQELKNRGCNTVYEAVRFQGDLLSGMRLGWRLPRQPKLNGCGLLKFYNQKHLVFCSATTNAKKTYRYFSKLDLQPKSLAKTLLQAERFTWHPEPDFLSALLAEQKASKNLKVQAAKVLERPLPVLCLFENDDKYILHWGHVLSKSLVECVFPGKGAGFGINLIKEIGNILQIEPEQKRRLILNRRQAGQIWLSMEIRSRPLTWLRPQDWYNFFKLRKFMALGRVQAQQSGLLVKEISNNTCQIYSVVAGIPYSSRTIHTTWATWISSSEGRDFLKAAMTIKPRAGGLDAERAQLMAALLWDEQQNHEKHEGRDNSYNFINFQHVKDWNNEG